MTAAVTAGTMAASSSSSMPAGPGYKDVTYNIQYHPIDNHTTVSRLNVDRIVANKHLPPAGAPSYPGVYPDRQASVVPIDYDPSFNARFPPTGWSSHPEWAGSVPDKWMDRNTGRNNSRHIVLTAARNGPVDSLARNGWSYSCLPYVNGESRKMIGSWVPDGVEGEWKRCRKTVKPPHIIKKELLEGVKWTKKPGFVGPTGYGPDRKLVKMARTQSETVLPLSERTMPGDRWSKTLVRDLENWETQKLGSAHPHRG
ncbi:unnamed protein product [Amoebophrya sp. A120]|nr:unnamed protein product [Amoebophrya sp. A120]|eukprot:GSA120T00012132001.1